MSWIGLSTRRLSRRLSSCRAFSADTGLFGLPELKQPGDFMKAASRAIEECDRLRLTLHDSSNTAQQVLFQADSISQAICNVIDAAELCRNVHADPLWRDAADRAYSALSEYMGELNTDPSIYNALVGVDRSALKTVEEHRFVDLLRAEFERDGIQLPEAQRAEVRRLQFLVTELEGLFHRNLAQPEETSALLSAKDVGDVFPKEAWPELGVSLTDGDRVHVTKEAQVLQTLLRYSPSPSLRREAYMEGNTLVADNLQVLDHLVSARHELARALGFESYADRFLRDKMAGNTETVQLFLRDLQLANEPRFQQELDLISRTKTQVEGSGKVEAWDVAFYTGILKSRHGSDIQDVTTYLTLDNTLASMQLLVKELFGIQMTEIVMSREERWDGGLDSMHRYDFVETRTGESLGTIYFDLLPRRAKYGHAAHFTVRCGCQINDSPDNPEYQRPIVALVCNLRQQGANFNLTHSEVETLFHEFGHALHSLLSRTKFQHLSGTRAAIDFVETPSHLFENYVWDAEFLRELTTSPITGHSLSNEQIRQLQQSRYDFAAIEKHNQILFANFDQRLFSNSVKGSTMDEYARLNQQLKIPYVPGTHWFTRFGHLVTYGAGYYGYLYSQVFAADLWEKVLHGKSLNRDAGENLWKNILQHGGAVDPSDMLLNTLGRRPDTKSFVGSDD